MDRYHVVDTTLSCLLKNGLWHHLVHHYYNVTEVSSIKIVPIP